MRVGFVTCENLPEPDFDEPLLMEACSRAGLECRLVPWDAPKDESEFDLLVLRSCWNYHLDVTSFLDWLFDAAKKVRILNPPDIVRWNADKGYLADLAAQGLPIVPTVWVSSGSKSTVKEAAQALSAEKVVVKPSVSAGSWNTMVFDSGNFDAAEHFLSGILADRGALVQPYLVSVVTIGERSVVWIDGEVTHTVVKRPRFTGEEESVSSAVDPTDVDRDIATRAVKGFADRLLYARVDLMLDDSGEWRISELELIEPSLFLLQHPEAIPKLVEALQK